MLILPIKTEENHQKQFRPLQFNTSIFRIRSKSDVLNWLPLYPAHTLCDSPPYIVTKDDQNLQCSKEKKNGCGHASFIWWAASRGTTLTTQSLTSSSNISLHCVQSIPHFTDKACHVIPHGLHLCCRLASLVLQYGVWTGMYLLCQSS